MQTIKLEKPWTYRTPLTTIDYGAGEHKVHKFIADQAEAEGVIDAPTETQESADGDGTAKASAPRRASKTKG